MNIKEIIGDMMIHAAASFTQTLAHSHTAARPPSSAANAASHIGSVLAAALMNEAMQAQQWRVLEGGMADQRPHPTYSDDQILAERMAVWNHPITLEPSKPVQPTPLK